MFPAASSNLFEGKCQVMLEINNLCKSYGKVRAVNNFSLELDKGEIFGLAGPNGSGKTTVMKIISGLISPTSGEVYVGGIDMARYGRKARARIGYMPDFFGVYENLKVYEYLDFYASICGTGRREREKMRGKLMDLMDLTGCEDEYVDTLSRGMKQRLCLARCLAHNPDLLVLDEPSSGMDPISRSRMKNILRTLRDMGKTIMISSHVLSDLEELCTGIGIMDKGSMTLCGTAEEICSETIKIRSIRIKVEDRVDDAVLLLKEFTYIDRIVVRNNVIEAGFHGAEDDLYTALNRLITSKIPVVTFAQLNGSLEDVFIEAAGREKI
jgi:ABC-2 type transport system ATP-binding protein